LRGELVLQTLRLGLESLDLLLIIENVEVADHQACEAAVAVDLDVVGLQLTLNTYGHMWPDADESARAAVGAVLATRADSLSITPILAD
jgi:hypothetical protein